MQSCVFRSEKAVLSLSVNAIMNKKEAYKSNPDIDMERSKNNYHLVAPLRYTYKK